jgi:rubrerythrin
MNILNIIDEIEKFDPEVCERLGSRRATLSNVGKMGMKAAVAAVPLALGSMFNKAYAGTSSHEEILKVLNFALTLEHLEATFYEMGMDARVNGNLLLQGRERRVFSIIGTHEKQHVEFLTKTIMALGGKPVAKPKFDFTAGGAFPTVFSDLATFMTLSQIFEDLGVRAYKGQATKLMENDAVLTAALQIHSVEARHAAKVRTMRGCEGWITNSNACMVPDAAAAVYREENNVVQLGINLQDKLDYPREQISEAFDEPLGMFTVLALAKPFIAG